MEKKAASVTFHYRNADPVFGVFQGTFRNFYGCALRFNVLPTAKECQALLEDRQQKLPIDVIVVSLPNCFDKP